MTGSDSEDSRSKVGGGGQEKGLCTKGAKTGADMEGGWVGGGSERQKWRERKREQEMPVCRWEAWKPEGNLNRLWLPLRHDRLLIPIPPLLLTHQHAHTYTCTHKPVMHVGTQSYGKKLNKKHSGSTNVPTESQLCGCIYCICESSRFSKVSTTQQQKPWKALRIEQLGAA